MNAKLLRVTPLGPLTFSKENNNTTNISVNNISKVPVLYKLQSTVWGKFKLRPRWGVLLPNEQTECRIALSKGADLSKRGLDRVILVCMMAPINSVDMDFTSAFWRHNICYDPTVEKHSLSFQQSKDAMSPREERFVPIYWR
ncbi:uncharacterized protein LOC111071473 [Drosophila obscura]|uniref:uncharacterized protein LOC111071473 n=1 Tax=Drosophila obscura TaxID=7282 RepID=UPI000B9FD2AC|nr:uncharacterized protein LOC111071473 [Drosophila obscura]